MLGVSLSPKLLGPTEANPKGHWESEDVYDLNERFFREAKTSWKDWTKLEATSDGAVARDQLIQQAIRYLPQDFADAKLFALKDPRFSRLLPEWEAACGAANIQVRAVVCLRNPLDVAASLFNRSAMPASAAHFLWLRYMLEAEANSRRLPRVFVEFSRMVEHWDVTIAKIADALKIELREVNSELRDEIDSFVDSNLKHHNSDDNALPASKHVHPWVKRAYRLLQQISNGSQSEEIFRQLDKIRAEFDLLSISARSFAAEAVENELKAAHYEHYYRVEQAKALDKDATIRVAEEENRQIRLEISEAQQALAEMLRKIEGEQTPNHVESGAQAGDASDVKVTVASLDRLLQDQIRKVAQFEDELAHLGHFREAASTGLSTVDARFAQVDETVTALTLRVDEFARTVSQLESQRDREVKLHEAVAEMMATNAAIRDRLDKAQEQLSELRRVRDEDREEFEKRMREEEEKYNLATQDWKSAIALEERSKVLLRVDLDNARSNIATIKDEKDRLEYFSSMQQRAAAVGKALLTSQAEMYRATAEVALSDLADRKSTRSTSKRMLSVLAKNAGAPEYSRQETEALLSGIADTGLFDEEWYLNAYPELARTKIDPLLHYALVGCFEGRDPNCFFSTTWYRRANQDLSRHENPLLHYSRSKEGRAFPNPFFDSDYYLQAHPDVAAENFDPLLHFLQHGYYEERRINSAVDIFAIARESEYAGSRNEVLHQILQIAMKGAVELPGVDKTVVRSLQESRIFDTAYYLRHAPEADMLSLDPIYDYVIRGWRLNKQPNLLFDNAYYLERNPDVAVEGINPFFHFIKYGAVESRSPHPLFDTEFYFKRHPDVKAANVNPIQHYLRHGWKPVYSPSPFFDTAWYIKTYSTAGKDRFNPLIDYLSDGRDMGRRPHPDFDPDFYAATSDGFKTSNFEDPFLYFVNIGYRRGQTQTSPARRFEKGSEGGKLVTSDRWYGPNWSKSISLLNQLGDEVQKADDIFPDVLERAREILASNPLRISVVMPAWNRAHVISAAIQSVFQQEYGVHELIVVDDGSSDDTVATIRDNFAAEIEERKLVIIARPHEGLCATRNAGLYAATGDLVAYLDTDNTWHRFYCLIMASLFAACPALGTAYCAENYHDADQKAETIVGEVFDRPKLLERNFIDLNCFVHRRSIVKRLGGFDVEMTRLVDWELIIRYTRSHPPAFLPVSMVDYYLDKVNLNNVTYSENWQSNWSHVIRKHHLERLRYGVVPLRVAYVIWDFPALSQTFVLNELRWLVSAGVDVRVYFKTSPDVAASLDFEIQAEQIDTAESLAEKLVRDKCTIMHSPFAYPATTLLTWPAARATGIPFTFMPGGVDISHFENRRRNRIGEIASDPLCLGLITLGKFHRRFLAEQGVPMSKMLMERQAVGLPPRYRGRRNTQRPKIISIGRFIEKKGLKYLIEAATQLRHCDIVLYGYGPLEADLKNLALNYNLTNVYFEGTLNNTEELHRAYFDADLFVLPCVEAENGDMDGLPTVLLEAMAAGIPVVTTKLANIPDLIVDGVNGFLASPADSTSLAGTINRALSLGELAKAQLLQRAEERARGFASVERMMNSLFNVWRSRSIDVVLVTYDTPKHSNMETTLDIIDRLYEHTVVPFNLIIVDNNSQPSFVEALENRYGHRHNFNLIELPVNVYVGPGTNIGVCAGSSEYVVYLCSKEGFILQNGWDLAIINAMDAVPDAGMGGYLISVPNFRTGREYTTYPSFDEWRNQHFARENPERLMRHLQGGLLVIRRSTFAELGGFSDAVPHNGTDIEYSYFLESSGVGLLDIPGIYSISANTWPGPETLIHEDTLAMHALTSAQANQFAGIANGDGAHCNICNWRGEKYDFESHFSCTQCGSSAFERSAMRCLSLSGALQRRPQVTCLDGGKPLVSALLPICREAQVVRSKDWVPGQSEESDLSPPPIVVVDLSHVAKAELDTVLSKLNQHAEKGRPVVFTGDFNQIAIFTKRLLDKGISVLEFLSASNVTRFEARPVRVVSLDNTRDTSAIT